MRQQGKVADAEPLCRQVLAGWRQIESESETPRNTLTAINILAELLHSQVEHEAPPPLAPSLPHTLPPPHTVFNPPSVLPHPHHPYPPSYLSTTHPLTRPLTHPLTPHSYPPPPPGYPLPGYLPSLPPPPPPRGKTRRPSRSAGRSWVASCGRSGRSTPSQSLPQRTSREFSARWARRRRHARYRKSFRGLRAHEAPQSRAKMARAPQPRERSGAPRRTALKRTEPRRAEFEQTAPMVTVMNDVRTRPAQPRRRYLSSISCIWSEKK